jgi:hypothetical protein
MDQKRMLSKALQTVRSNVGRISVFIENVSRTKVRNKTITLILDDAHFERNTFISEPFNLKKLPSLIDIDKSRSHRRSRSLPQVDHVDLQEYESLQDVDSRCRNTYRRSRSLPQMGNSECTD